MEYITVKEASKQWNTDISTIGKLLRAGKIVGATKLGGHWIIPKGLPKPIDGRTRTAKKSKETTVFRFPLLVNFPEDSFVPSLSLEETKLYKAQKDFYALEFQKSLNIFKDLSENAENIYVKICAHFFMCLLSVVYNGDINFNQYYCGMNLLLSAEFSHKKEMELFSPLLCYNLGRYMNIPEKLNSDILYKFHASALYMNTFLSIFKLPPKNFEAENLQCLESYETLCILMERDGYYIEAQKMHMILFTTYFSIHNNDMTSYHISKAVKIAYEQNLIYTVADIAGYYPDEIYTVLKEYPSSFAERIRKSSKTIYDNFAKFAESTDITNLYSKLSENDYRYLAYAIKGFTNKQVAEICNISERTVAKRYNDIYDKLSVNSKQELVRETIISLGDK